MMISPDELNTKQFLYTNSLVLLRSEAQDLVKNGTTGQDLQKELESFNQQLVAPVDANDVKAIFEQYDPAMLNKKRIEQAIASKDVQELFKCAGLIAIVKRRSLIEFAILEDSIKQAFGKSLDRQLFKNTVNAEMRKQEMEEAGKKPDIADVATNWARGHQDEWAYDEDAQSWRMFNGEYWPEQASKSSFLDQYGVAALQEAGIPVNSSNALNLFQRIAASYCKRQFINPPNKVNFANGTLELDTMQILPHNKEDNFTYCYPYCYDPYGKHPTIDTFLEEIILELREGHLIPNRYGIQAYIAHVGLALIGDVRLHKALIALGLPGSGKSTLLDLANRTCGILEKQYVPHDVFSRELEGKRSRFKHGKKRIACIDEVPSEAFQEEELVKEMMAHSGVSMRGIGIDEQEDNQWKPKLLLVTNDDPHYKDISSAIKRRLIIIRCPIQRFDEPKPGQPEQNPLLLDSLLAEIGAFAATCIRYAMEVCRRGYYPQSATMKRDLDQIAIAGNPLKACLEDKFFLDPTTHTVTADLYAEYETYCNRLGNVKPLGAPKFASALCGMGIGITAKKKRGERALIGIRLRTENDPYPSAEEEQARYTDSPLIMDSWDGSWTAGNATCPSYEPAPQGDSQEPWTAGAANSENSDDSTIMCNGMQNIHKPVEKNGNGKKPSQPSKVLINPLHKADDARDSTENQPSIALDVSVDITPDNVNCYPQEVRVWHQVQGLKMERTPCLRKHKAPSLPWFNPNTHKWEECCTQCYPGLRASKGRDCEL